MLVSVVLSGDSVHGENGLIVFIKGGDEAGLYTMEADGSDLQPLNVLGNSPDWSPDGSGDRVRDEC